MKLFGNDDGKGSMFNIEKRTNLPTLIIIGLVIVFFLVFTLVSNLPSCGGSSKKEALAADKCTKIDNWYYAESPYSDSSIISEMEKFYTATGVQPFLYVVTGLDDCTEEELNQLAEDYYKNELFQGGESDEGHMVICFFPKMSSFVVGYYVGTDAATVIDSAALSTFTSTLDTCYNQNTLSGAKVIKNTFKKAAESIMGTGDITMYILVGVLALCFIYFGMNLIKSRKNQSDQPQADQK